MAGEEKLKNAPITEAIFDIRVNLPPEVDLLTLASYQEDIRNEFPEKKDRIAWEAGFEIKKGVPEVIMPKGGTLGYLFLSPDKTRIVQPRLDGYTYNKLRPYDSWKTFRDEAQRL